MIKRFLLIVCLAGLVGCAATADTFPLNDAAKRLGPVHVSFVRNGIGRGPVTIMMPDGEVLTGEQDKVRCLNREDSRQVSSAS